MKRLSSFLAALLLAFVLPLIACAQGQTVTVATTFSGSGIASQAYADALEAWELASGNTADDYSGMPDDAWQESVDAMLSAGTLDLLYTSLSLPEQTLSQLVPVSELLAAYPDLSLRGAPAAADGVVYAMPVRFSFEALYVNSDIFTEQGIPLPTSWETLLDAVKRLKSAGITPIANAIGDYPAALFDCAVLSAVPAASYQDASAAAENAAAGLERLRTLYENGAFGSQALTWTDMDAEAAFIAHQAAMRVDGEWLCESIPEDQWNNTVVLPFPGGDANARVAGTNAGFFITRAAFDDPARREAAVSLLKNLTSEPTASSLFLACGDSLLQSACTLFDGEMALCPPLMDLWSMDAYDALMNEMSGAVSGTTDVNQAIRTAFQQ